MSVIGGLFYLTGGLAAFLVGLCGPSADNRGWLELVGLLIVASTLMAMRFAANVTHHARCLMNLAATAFILLLVVLAGHTEGSAALFWLFVYVPMDSFFFFAWRWAIPMMVWAAAATAIATFVAGVISPTEWCVLSIAGLVASFAIGWLVRSASAAEWDPGVGMLSRVGFFRKLAARCGDAAHVGRHVSLAVVNVDRIDRVIATRGRAAAELVVRRLVAEWTASVPSSVRWGRLQDYEFALLWDNGPGFDDYLETVRAAARPISTVSIGVADSAVPDTPIQLLTKALAGVAYSERSGGNRVTRHGLVATQVDELSAAIATGQISVFYQPIVAIADGRICGAEALARWIHPERGVIAPADFIGVAEQADLIGALGAQVLRRACVDAAEWRCDGDVAPKVTVNVSGQQLHDAGFVSIVRDSLRRSGLDAWRLVLEVTETTVAGDDPQALSALRELRGHGVKVAIDDFGTGYSNLSRLAGLPIDVLKLDRSFVAQIEHSPRILALVRNIIAMARDLDLLTVAEGVETQEQADLLRAVGAPEGQGWLWSAPVPADQFVLARAGTPDRPVAKQITT